MCVSFFHKHKTPNSLASRKVPFPFPIPKNTKGIHAAGTQLAEGAYCVGHTKAGYSLYAFKSLALGHMARSKAKRAFEAKAESSINLEAQAKVERQSKGT